MSWKDLEDLVGDLLAAEFGCRFERFGSGPDGGIDLRATLSNRDDGRRVIVQVKHYLKSTLSDLKKACRDSATTLMEAEVPCDRYFVTTSRPLSPDAKAQIASECQPLPCDPEDVWGQDDIASLLRKHEVVERRFPKLWLTRPAALERILHSGLYAQNATEIGEVEQELKRFVYHDKVGPAQKILDQEKIIVLSGPPGVGKTTLGRVLAAKKIDEGSSFHLALDTDDVRQALGHAGPTVILFDDCLGQTKLDDFSINQLDQKLPRFVQQVQARKDTFLIVTSRDYILAQGMSRGARIAEVAADTRSLVLTIDDLTLMDKARILYNHLIFSELSDEDIQALTHGDIPLRLTRHPNFNPRLIKTITEVSFRRLRPEEPIVASALAVLDNPTQLWSAPFHEHLTDAARLVVFLTWLTGRVWNASLYGSYMTVLERRFSEISIAANAPNQNTRWERDFQKAVRELEGNLCRRDNARLSFSNPGVRDFVEAEVAQGSIQRLLIENAHNIGELAKLSGLNAGPPDLWESRLEELLADEINDEGVLQTSTVEFLLFVIRRSPCRKPFKDHWSKVLVERYMEVFGAFDVANAEYEQLCKYLDEVDTTETGLLITVAEDLTLPDSTLANLINRWVCDFIVGLGDPRDWSSWDVGSAYATITNIPFSIDKDPRLPGLIQSFAEVVVEADQRDISECNLEQLNIRRDAAATLLDEAGFGSFSLEIYDEAIAQEEWHLESHREYDSHPNRWRSTPRSISPIAPSMRPRQRALGAEESIKRIFSQLPFDREDNS